MTTCFSQKQYDFDYVIEYELNLYKDSIQIKNQHLTETDKKIHRYYLINSKNNDYLAIITEKDSLHYQMVFTDYNGVYSDVIFLKSDFNKAEFINIKCEYVSKFSNPYKYQTKNYDFFILNDTIINDKSFNRYKLSSIKPKRSKRKKLGTEFYIIDNSTDFHLPILHFSTAFEEWKVNKNLPNGIMSERYFINYYGKMSFSEKLVKYRKLEKKLNIPVGCNDTKFIIE